MKLTTRTLMGAAVAGLRGRLSGSDGDDFHARTADSYYELLGDSKGALMKAGQMLSFLATDSVVPREFQPTYRAAFARLRDDAPPMAPELAERTLRDELRARAVDAFAEFDWQPLAAASIGQVHAARLHDGRAVAVKIQYPGVDEAIRSDLKNIELLATFMTLMAGAFPRSVNADIRGASREIGARILEELDYRREAANQGQFASRYRGHPFIRIPEVIQELSGARVLTQELCSGRSWAQALTAEQPLRDLWAEGLWRFVYGSYLRFGLLNLDPHPGNFVFHEDGSVSFLDFGCVKSYPRERIDLTAEIVRSAVRGDALATWHLCVEAGYWRASDPVTPEEVLTYWREPFRHVWAEQPFTLTPSYVARWIASRCSPTGPCANAVRHLTMPLDIVVWPRVEVSLASMLAELGATNDWGSLHAEYEGSDEPATAMGRLDRAHFTEAAASRR